MSRHGVCDRWGRSKRWLRNPWTNMRGEERWGQRWPFGPTSLFEQLPMQPPAVREVPLNPLRIVYLGQWRWCCRKRCRYQVLSINRNRIRLQGSGLRAAGGKEENIEEKKIFRMTELGSAFSGEPDRASVGLLSHAILWRGDWRLYTRHWLCVQSLNVSGLNCKNREYIINSSECKSLNLSER